MPVDRAPEPSIRPESYPFIAPLVSAADVDARRARLEPVATQAAFDLFDLVHRLTEMPGLLARDEANVVGRVAVDMSMVATRLKLLSEHLTKHAADLHVLEMDETRLGLRRRSGGAQ